jgi:hypothetical protein
VHDRELDVPKEKERERDVEHENNNIVNVLTIRHFFFWLAYIQGGKCTQGEEDLGFFRDVVGDDNKTQTEDHLAYCECKEGWIGL